ncbi:MAG: serine/threonine-protein kinase [Nannocystaceae bacterium]
MRRRPPRMLVVVVEDPSSARPSPRSFDADAETVAEVEASLDRRALLGDGAPEDPTIVTGTAEGHRVFDVGSSLARGSTFEQPEVEGQRFRSPSRGAERSFSEPVRLGRFEVLGRLGAGGMGEVFLAQDGTLGRRVALKVVRSDLDAANGDATARIIREAQLMARVVHPNVVRIYDVDQVRDRVYITMELVEGTTLRGWLAAEPRSWREIVGVFVLAGRGLAAAHAMGLVHRDFKPTNVLVGDDGRVMVADFGLARALTSDDSSFLDATDREPISGGLAGSGSTQPLTSRGAVLGTPGYMSPEQLMGEPADARSDVFSFCVALYEALYGVRPFAGDTRTANLVNIENGALVPPRRDPGVPKRIVRALRRGLQASPDDRFPSVEALLGELDRARALRLRSIVGAAMIGGAGLLVGAAVSGERTDPCEAAAHELDDAWGPARKEAIDAAFAATRVPYARDAAARASAAIDEYAAAWSAARVDACDAREVRHALSPRAFDLRMICLGRGERALRAVIEQLASADATTVEDAAQAIAALPEIDGCGDVEALTLGVQPPEDPAVRAKVEAAREVIARAEALHATGHYREGLAVIDRELPAVELLGYAPALAEAKLVRGRLLAELGVLDQAEAAIKEAIDLAEGSRHDGLAVEGWLALTRFTRRLLADPARARDGLNRAHAAARRIGEPLRVRTEMFLEEGIVLRLLGRHEPADQALRSALGLLGEGNWELFQRATITAELAITSEALRREDEARDAYEAAIEAALAAWGPWHSEIARIWNNYATYLMVQGDVAMARQLLEESLSLLQELHGPEHLMVAQCHLSWVMLALTEGEYREAEAHAEEAVEITISTLPDGHPDRATAQEALGTARYFLGDYSGAIAAYSSARDERVRSRDADPIAMAEVLSNLGETYLTIGRIEEASTIFDEVEGDLERSAVKRPDLEARVVAGRGRLHLARGSVGAALEALEAAWAARDDLQEDPMLLGELRDALAAARASRSALALPAKTGDDEARLNDE